MNPVLASEALKEVLFTYETSEVALASSDMSAVAISTSTPVDVAEEISFPSWKSAFWLDLADITPTAGTKIILFKHHSFTNIVNTKRKS